jgi:hypothetical protein
MEVAEKCPFPIFRAEIAASTDLTPHDIASGGKDM